MVEGTWLGSPEMVGSGLAETCVKWGQLQRTRGGSGDEEVVLGAGGPGIGEGEDCRSAAGRR